MSNVITDKDAKRNIAANVRRLLKARGWRAVDLAKATSENEMRISYLLREKRLPTAAFLARLAEALDTTTDELLSKPSEMQLTSS